MFYNDIKEYMSPSALAQWIDAKSSFIRTYFRGEKSPETSAMKAGTAVHRLIEAGLLPVEKRYNHNEEEIKLDVNPEQIFMFMGRPDSWGDVIDDEVDFVDYKTGKSNGWAEKLPTDIKMKATAWLVWKATGCPKKVHGHIEFIQTEWDPVAKEVVPIEGKDHEIVSIDYRYDDLEEFSGVIAKEMAEVNEYYERWKKSTGDFVSKEDVARYEELKREITDRETELDEIGDRIMSQMEFGGEENHKTNSGTFYITTKETYEYPSALKIWYRDYGLTLEDADEVAACTKTAKKNFELSNEPKTVKRSIGYRPAKVK